MKKKVDPVVDEAIETLNMKDGPSRRRLLEGAGLFSATAAASALIAACTSSSTSTATTTSPTATAKAAVGNFPATPPWQFWFVNHVTTNLFFVPTQNGFADAAKLLGLPTPKWGGSTTSTATDMVSYLNTAIAAKANGIATTVINATSFTTPVANAMNAGIPVISYNADGVVSHGVADIGTNRLCYVGQALYNSGIAMGNRIKSLVTTPGEVVIFIATPGTGNIQPRYDGAASVLTPAGYTVKEIATGALTSGEGAAEKAYLTGAKSTLKGAFAVDAGSTEQLGPSLASVGLAGKIPAGGFDLTPGTLTAINSGQLDFTIDQEPYLQGFLPTLYLYLFNLTGGLVSPPNTDTGLTFVTKSNVGPYLTTKTSYEGSAPPPPTLVSRSGPIQNPIATSST
ncbi:MAG TPA: substrate-binding domain-containing protein [Streptosporangiaceae bacterium]|nr:substrate-binding domain-containing protein [Streptosporangiaceae bacterium]